VATNAAGNSLESNREMILTNTVPNAPSITSVVAGINRITFSYIPPAFNGGLPITNYRYSIDASNYVTMDVSLGGTYVIQNGATDAYTNYQVSLLPGNSYRVSLKAVNILGDSIAFDSSYVIPYTVTSAPSITGISVTDGTLFVYFTPPSQLNGSAVVAYKYSLNGASYVLRNEILSPLIIHEGIANNTSYYVTLIAVNGAGDSLPSVQSETVTPINNSQVPQVIIRASSDTTTDKTVFATLGDVIAVNTGTGGGGNSSIPQGAITSSQNTSIKKILTMFGV
jgi:hypothetical protein